MPVCPTCGGTGKVTCSRCKGSGTVTETCFRCGGTGRITKTCPKCGGAGWIETTCPDCGGSGVVQVTKTCATCNGTGKVTVTETCPCCLGHGDYLVCPMCGYTTCRSTGISICPMCFTSMGTGGTCAQCGGSGKITTEKTCPDCGGTGKITKWVTCGRCGGTGRARVTCTRCGGSGKVTVTCPDCDGSGKVTKTCPVCGGSGKVTCPDCGGSGIIEEPPPLEVEWAVEVTVNVNEAGKVRPAEAGEVEVLLEDIGEGVDYAVYNATGWQPIGSGGKIRFSHIDYPWIVGFEPTILHSNSSNRYYVHARLVADHTIGKKRELFLSTTDWKLS